MFSFWKAQDVTTLSLQKNITQSKYFIVVQDRFEEAVQNLVKNIISKTYFLNRLKWVSSEVH